MTQFRVPPGNPLKTAAPVIEALDGESARPAIVFSSSADGFFADSRAVAENVASILNGNSPPHDLSRDGHHVHYQRIPSGIVLRQRGEDGGVSRDGLTLIVNDASGVKIQERLTATFMQKLCTSMTSGASGGPSGRAPKQPSAQI